MERSVSNLTKALLALGRYIAPGTTSGGANMQVLQEDSVSHPIASLRNATTSGGEDKLARAAALVSVSNRIRHEDVPRLLDAAGAVIGQLASAETVIRIADTNPDAIWIFSRKGRDRAEGFVATLLLNEAGRIALFDGSLDLLDPQPQYLAAQHESPRSETRPRDGAVATPSCIQLHRAEPTHADDLALLHAA